MGEDEVGIANHRVQPDSSVNRVFVGIPDQPTAETIRIHALNLAADLYRYDKEGGQEQIIAAAVVYEGYILGKPA